MSGESTTTNGGAGDPRERIEEVRFQLDQIATMRHELEQQSAALYEDLLRLDPDSEAGADDPESELRVQLAETELKYKRALADFQNFRRRSADNEAEARRQGVTRVVESLLGVLDNFGLALNVDPETSSASSVLQGVRFIHDEMVRALASVGLRRIEPARGDAFDADLHQAVMQQQTDDVPPGCVVSVQAAGYAIGDRVVRPARVAVRPNQDTAQRSHENGGPNADV